MSVKSEHLEFAEIVAEARGATSGERIAAHLAGCPECQAEASAWTAVAAGVRCLAADMLVPAMTSPESTPATRPGRTRPGWRMLAAAGLAAAAVTALLVVLLPGHNRLTRPLHTAWQAARPLPQSPAAGPAAPAGQWRVASYLVSAGWKQHTAGREPGYLTCPVAGTCYVEGDNSASDSGPADMDSFFVSHDGGLSWSVLPVPSGLTFSTALSCAAAADCAAGGSYGGQPVFVRTTDGGHSWTIDPLPANIQGVIFQLSCPTTATCGALATTSPAQLPIEQRYYGGVTFLRITGAGRRFAASSFPAGVSMQAMNCPTARHCVTVGVSSGSLGANDIAATGLVQITTDGGATWTHGRLAAGFSPGYQPVITCPDASHCFMLGTAHPKTGTGDVAMSADGGRTWVQRPLPAGLPQPYLSGISCPTDSACYVSGTEAVPQRFGKLGSNGGSSMILITSNAGQTWDRVRFAVPARIPAGTQIDAFMQIGGIQCPRVDRCVALAVSEQGSKSTPVYTYGTAP
jgi:photosystem II stability/assembly factor-like uncharacterized protein